MNVYRIEPLSDQYGLLELSAKAITDVYGDLGYDDLREVESSLADTWPTCAAALYDLHTTKVRELHRMPDVYVWNGCFLALTARARHALSDVLTPLGEFLPFTLGAEAHYLLSLHRIVEPDLHRTEELIENGAPMGIKSLAFELPDIGAPAVFKTEFDYFNHVYCTEVFKQHALASGLTLGVNFCEDLAYRRPV